MFLKRDSFDRRCGLFALMAMLCVIVVPELFGATASIDFNRDIRPIFSENCYACHGPDKNKRKAGLRLDVKEDAFKKLDSDNFAIVPGKPAAERDAESDLTPGRR